MVEESMTYNNYLVNFRKIVDLVMQVPKDPMECDCPKEERKFLSGRKIAEGLHRCVYQCQLCGRYETKIEEGQDPRI
jgi:hypothetical protein